MLSNAFRLWHLTITTDPKLSIFDAWAECYDGSDDSALEYLYTCDRILEMRKQLMYPGTQDSNRQVTKKRL